MADDNNTKLREAMKRQEAQRLTKLKAELARIKGEKKQPTPKPKQGG